MMNAIATKTGCFILEPNVIRDARGYFMESFNERVFSEKTGLQVHFVQDNQSFSGRGVLRGLHYQTGDRAQAKLVRVLSGAVLDVAVDIRPGSPTFGQYDSVVLSDENQKQFFVPRGFAHGFLVLSETTTFFYKCDNFYDRDSEGGIRYDDPEIGINWPSHESIVVSEKDQHLPDLQHARPVW
jgi:dTDP-4-dehydrorhamnose 3,5-epimerase